MIILLWIIIVVLMSVIVFLLLKDKKETKKNLKEEEEEIKEHLKKEKEMLSDLHKKEIEGIQQVEKIILEKRNEFEQKAQEEKDRLNKEIINQKNLLENYKTDRITIAENEIALFREKKLNEIKQELIKVDLEQQELFKKKQENYKIEAQKETEEINQSICGLRQCCEDLKAKRDITLDLIKEEEKIKQEKDFYRIILKKEDIEDIQQLVSIEKYLHNKDVLHKLIYKTYIETSMNAMFGRIGAKDTPGVYKITNLNNNMCYIGQSTNLKNRLKAHIQASIGISTIAAQLVHDKMAEEGLENFIFQVIEECSKDKLNDREKYFINYYDSCNYGYNRTGGGARL